MSHCSDDLWENIRIATPCKANWDAMTGDEQVRACGACKKNVYNISMMSKPEAEQIIREKEGNLCLRLYRRRDGKILTADCPKALRAIRLKMAVASGFIIATVGGWLGLKWATNHIAGPMMGGVAPQQAEQTQGNMPTYPLTPPEPSDADRAEMKIVPNPKLEVPSYKPTSGSDTARGAY